MKKEQVCCGRPMDPRLRTYKTGTKQGRAQCRECGNCFGDACKVSPGMPLFDEDAYAAFTAQRRAGYAAAFAASTARFSEYRAVMEQVQVVLAKQALADMPYHQYLQSAQWRRKRNEAMVRDRFQCQVCFGHATEVHHITYAHRGDEYLWELVSLCRSCHQEQHPEKTARQ